MTTLLRLDASARRSRSLSRTLGDTFEREWRKHRPDDAWIIRDLAEQPPAHITEPWIAAAFTPLEARTPEQHQILAASDDLIDELAAADVLVVNVPMYNYGMPSALKAWVDNVVRVGRTFSFDLGRGDFPLRPIMSGKQMVVLSSSGEFGFDPAGIRGDMDQLIPHLRTVKHYLGVSDMHIVRVEYQEFGDARHKQSMSDAIASSKRLAGAVAQAITAPAAAAE
ncbi:NAD(P)H-dependent oxidoreductase [Sinorhizobium sp. 8-89]|uniref:FMN-dependent NADH-azoreductase n=1 Tax=Sinorhizobium sp. 7-81 TaxID=3049087 RepID=UPI0024C3C7D7|nr:NAD(P)H-dependent oxidoreductase [Sinorhizobium sp. 7-81]MDK1385809.1 NAD(P)H-dependent oxidoreductase [Sinorhizobium sp. 7-81]